jgi:hypothetical protein
MANGYDIPQQIPDGLRSMALYCAKITDPLGAAPPLNDSEYLSAKSLRLAQAFFPDDPVFDWFASEGASGRPPDFNSLLLPYAGQAVMRSGWDRKDFWLLAEIGPFGTGHMHEDKLGFTITAHGRRMIVDPGRNAYEASTMRDYSVNASAHSTVLFDGLFQARRLAPKGSLNKSDKPLDAPWKSTAVYDHVVGSYGADEREVFALPTDPPGDVAPEHFRLVLDKALGEDDVQTSKRMVQHRHFIFVKPHYWVVVDTFDPLDDQRHVYTSLFQLGDGETSVNGQGVMLGKPGEAGMTLASAAVAANGKADRAAPQVIRGQDKPFILGWTFKDGKAAPSPTAVFRHRFNGRGAAAYAIVPHAKDANPEQVVIECGAGTGSGVYTVRVEPGAGLPAANLRIPADGAAAEVLIASPAQGD